MRIKSLRGSLFKLLILLTVTINARLIRYDDKITPDIVSVDGGQFTLPTQSIKPKFSIGVSSSNFKY